jgi:lysophospholipase L1-like esterase
VSNLAVPGTTPLARSNDLISRSRCGPYTCWGIIQFGTNSGSLNISPDVFEKHMLKHINRLHKANATTVLLIIEHTDTWLPSSHQLRSEYADKLLSICDYETAVYCLDLRSIPKHQLFPLPNAPLYLWPAHPHKAGHELIANLILAAIGY